MPIHTGRSRRSAASRRRSLRWMFAGLIVFGVACDNTRSLTPAFDSSLDTQLRQSLGVWGAIPIGPTPPQSPALVELGQALFFDKVLSGNRDVACATCHDPLTQFSDGLSLSIGTGGVGAGQARTLGAGRQFVPRHAPSLLNSGLGFFYVLWDGRVNEERFAGPFQGPTGVVLPPGLTNLLAAQAMLPVLNRVEMRGERGDRDVFGNVNALAEISDSAAADVWKATMNRLLAIQAYAAKFTAAYPGIPTTALGFQHAANALAAFQIHALTRTNSPFDRYLARDDDALSDEAKRGALLFFGEARCSSCHSGALLGGQQFANVGVPQLGPGVGAAAPRDIGRAEHFPGITAYQFAFRVPPLRNVELTAPYMHNGAYRTLENVVRHYTNVDSAHRAYDVSQLDPALRATHRNDFATISAVLGTRDFRVIDRISLNATQQKQLIAFLKSLTDPSAKDLNSLIPAGVPSGLPIGH
jgi:cytochrome c peroxidase